LTQVNLVRSDPMGRFSAWLLLCQTLPGCGRSGRTNSLPTPWGCVSQFTHRGRFTWWWLTPPSISCQRAALGGAGP